MDISESIEKDKETMEIVQTNLDLHLHRISLERRSLMIDCDKYRQCTRNDNREDH